MSEVRSHDRSLADFLAWETAQDRRYEFVGGQAFMMAGGTQAHALIAANLIALLRPLLRGSPSRPSGSDLRIPTPGTGHSRYPDVTIDCGGFDPGAHDAGEPRIVFEVLSKSTGWYDQTQKVRDYDSVASIRQYVCVSQSESRVSLWLRDNDGRLTQREDIVDMQALIALDGLSKGLRLADIYEDTGVSEIPLKAVDA